MRTHTRAVRFALFAGLFASGALAHGAAEGERLILSPSGRLSLSFRLAPDGQPAYALSLGPRAVLRESRLGIALADGPALTRDFVVDSAEEKTADETWETVWGEERRIRNRYRELAITLRQPSVSGRRPIVRFRLFDDGLGFRYELPRQEGVDYLTVSEEKTEFNLTGDHTAFWIPGDSDSNEYTYSRTPLSGIDASISARFTEIAVRTPAGHDVVQTPLMMKTADGLYINIHEAALVDYPAMRLKVDRSDFSLSSHLVPDAVGNKAYLQTPCRTPWRTVVVSDRAADVLASRLILNLNEPSKIADTSWIKPRKYVGIWWAMHVGRATWNYADHPNVELASADWAAMTPNGRHGATTENTKRYIDFAAKHAHEAVRPTGLHRTWPNWLACEAARGNEFNAWSAGNPPEHETILPFTRLMGGPMDYTPGIFQIELDAYAPGKKERVHTTLAKQLALYVTLYSPLQMAADLPENYERLPDAFRFIEDVAVDWDETRVLEAEPGDFVTIARKARGRDAWFIGAITDEQARIATIPLSWLGPGRSFVATVYADAADAHWEKNPMAYRIRSFLVDDRTLLKVPLAPGGGAAISIRPAAGDEARKLKRYQG